MAHLPPPPPLGRKHGRKQGPRVRRPEDAVERRGAEERAHAPARSTCSSVSYPGGAGVKKARKAVVKKPFVKPPPLDAELRWAPTRCPASGRRASAAAARRSRPPPARARRTSRVRRRRRPARRRRRAHGRCCAARRHGGADAPGREPGVVRVDARRGVADRGVDAHGASPIQKAPAAAAASAPSMRKMASPSRAPTPANLSLSPHKPTSDGVAPPPASGGSRAGGGFAQIRRRRRRPARTSSPRRAGARQPHANDARGGAANPASSWPAEHARRPVRRRRHRARRAPPSS